MKTATLPQPAAAEKPATSSISAHQATPIPKQQSLEPKKAVATKCEQIKKRTTGGKGGGSGNGGRCVDISRLDMRIGKIVKAWQHPDADGLYVVEGQRCNI